MNNDSRTSDERNATDAFEKAKNALDKALGAGSAALILNLLEAKSAMISAKERALHDSIMDWLDP